MSEVVVGFQNADNLSSELVGFGCVSLYANGGKRPKEGKSQNSRLFIQYQELTYENIFSFKKIKLKVGLRYNKN